jgi:two-component system, NtrC family, sensor kinase
MSAATLALVAMTDPVAAARLREGLERLSCEVKVVGSVIDAIAELHGVEYDLAIIAKSLPPRGALDVVRVARELSPDTDVVVMLEDGERDPPIECVRCGAFDFLRQPLSTEELGEVVERARVRRNTQTTTALSRTTHAILAGTDPQKLPSLIVDLAAELLSADGVGLYRTDASGQLAAAYARGFSRESDREELLALATRLSATRASVTPLLLPDDATTELDGLSTVRIRSAIICPILFDGRVAGVLAAERSSDPRPFRRSDATRFGVFASQLRLAFENARLLEKTVATERLAAIGELAAGVAHEINNPLQYVLQNCVSALEALEELGAPAQEIQEMLVDVRDGAERIREISRDLRTLSRGTSAPEVFDLADSVRSALRIAASPLRAASVKVATRIAARLPVSGSPGRMCQVFVNLLVNAAQAADSPSVAGPVRVEVDASEAGGEIVATIRDTGPGMAPDHLARIFDAFFTTKSSENGTGLGLSIARAIVADHGGRIEVTSELGKGTTFRITLPSIAVRSRLGMIA